ncbi:uncharacterized protein B0I36DRAFT_369540 [Microdochium trichocladiopsis]|uniref:SMP-30/Gluconolactonase/LRE-like region domain-containing protein n=1 Tax=Microdochium trichocladiopsis TaxID=1682393 RepID=A0A9P8XSI8_9PEZI|nr:uncharacterized protein B0I36DRAFT_369540 [Microdochium trichocladiopsis]KAH7014602.1 hypothetical protein B0I36DRAFT_369540 [Microdochium trichocladiopsis]
MQIKLLHVLFAGASAATLIPQGGARFNDACLPRLPSRIVARLGHQPSFLENLAFRDNGDLLVTQNHPKPQIYTIKQPWLKNARLTLLHEFQDTDGAAGVVQVAPDHFVVAAAKWNGFNPVPASATLQFIRLAKNGSVAETGFVGRYPELGLFNGLARLGDYQNSILAADSALGVIHKFSPLTGDHHVVVDVPELKATDPSAPVPIGVNGIKLHDSHLYWTNSNTASIFRLAITEDGLPAKSAKVELVSCVPDGLAIDDFAIDVRGNIWVAAVINNEGVVVRPDGSTVSAVGSAGEMTVASGTALAFGNTAADSHILYATTAGGLPAPVNGTVIEPGKVVAIDATAFLCLVCDVGRLAIGPLPRLDL